MNQSKRILRDIPSYARKKFSRAIFSYSTPILGLKTSDPDEKPTLLGSATLVQYGNDKGLLTAQHVITQEGYKDCERIGLIISEKEHRFTIHRQYLQVESTNPDSTEYGPDIAFIKIPEIDASTINAQKGFWQMDSNRKKVAKVLTTRNYGIWVIFGCPSDYQRTEPSKSSFEHTFVPGALVAMSNKPSFFSKKSYDYIEMPASYEVDNDLPDSFAGISGGGIWHVTLSTNTNEPEEIQVHHPTLMGLAFYETAVKDCSRVIRCHGAKSIYVKMLKIHEAV